MKGKVGLVLGLAAGYVLGTRAGRERYEQIKAQAAKVWNLDPVQEQVGKVTDFAKSSALAVPNALWDGAVKVTKAISSKGSTPGQKLDSAIKTGKDQAGDIDAAVSKSAQAAKDAADKAIDDASDAASARNGA